ncbi:MAG: GNAT family N-acetyltransferase [Bacteroidales bacterium]|nr:GNAT family N-acetyltransferase [Bacteroidales bacterium]
MEVLFLDIKNDQDIYNNVLSVINCKNPYYSLEFFEVFSSGLRNLICFDWQKGSNHILLPGYIRDINDHKDLKDFTSPYGYSGPVWSPEINKKYLYPFWQEVQDWMVNNNIISSFIRFSLNNNHYGFPGEVKQTLSNIKGRILPANQQWKSFERKVRKNVNKAKREGLTIRISSGNELSDDLLDEFHQIYFHTLERKDAEKDFFFRKEGFRRFISQNGSNCLFVFTFQGTNIVSVEMILLLNDTLFSFLGGTMEKAFNKRPNDLLKYEVINWARENNYSYYILGGGYGSDDGIFEFKRTFFPNDVTKFLTGRLILDHEIYRYLVTKFYSDNAFSESDLEMIRKRDYFPEYRIGL